MTAGGACPICGMGTTGGWGSPHLVRPCPLALQEHTQRMAHAEVEHRARLEGVWQDATAPRQVFATDHETAVRALRESGLREYVAVPKAVWERSCAEEVAT